MITSKRQIRRQDVILLAGLAMLLLAIMPLASRAESGPGRSLEQQLLEDLETQPLDADAERDLRKQQPKPGPGQPPTKPGASGEREPGSLDRQLSRELGPAAVSEDANPVWDIVRQMQRARSLIGQDQTGQETQKLQAKILASLDELLKTARSQSQSSSSGQRDSQNTSSRRTPSQPSAKPGGQGKPTNKPATSGATQAGKPQPARRPDMAEMREVIKSVWGELPQHQRDEMLELAGEEFLHKYELLIEAYFKRLAEEQGGGGRGER